MAYILKKLPPVFDAKSVNILEQVVKSHRYLAELKGISGTIPNEAILINTLSLQEAKDSSAVENIITTHDELYKNQLFPEYTANAAAKEVENYSEALLKGFKLVKKQGVINSRSIKSIQEILEKNDAGFRKLSGTELKNDKTGEIVYIPPQNETDIIELMKNLEKYLNDESFGNADPLVKMAVIHFQFESIHPFYDGNGRTGRIINILYLVQKGLLDIPVLYLSRYIINTKTDYYRLLQNVRDYGDWEPWVLYMLVGVEETAKYTIEMIKNIKSALMEYKHRIRKEFHFYSQDLINNLFFHPYTKIEFIERDLKVSRITAGKYLDSLSKSGYLKKLKLGKSNYYINEALFKIFAKM